MFVVVFCDDKEQAAADTIAKIDRVSKLVTRGGVTMKVQFMAKSLMDNFGEQSTSYEKGSCPKRDSSSPYRKDGGSSNKQDRPDSRGRQYNCRGSFKSHERNNFVRGATARTLKGTQAITQVTLITLSYKLGSEVMHRG